MIINMQQITNKLMCKMSMKRGKLISLLTYFCVTCVLLNLVAIINATTYLSSSEEFNEGGLNFYGDDEFSSTNHIEEQCIQKCPDQVSISAFYFFLFSII